MRIAIIGAGGVGGLLGALLADAGHSLGFVARGEHLRAMRSRGLRAFAPDREVFIAAPEATESPADLGPSDVVFLCTKLYDLAAAAHACAPLVHDETLVVTTQNGVEADEIVGRSLPGARVSAGLVYVAAARVAPGEIRQDSAFFRLTFGSRNGANPPQSARLAEACRTAGIEATLTSDIVSRLWTKLVFIASVSAVACMSNLQIGPIRSCAETRALLADAMREVVAVGRAHGVPLVDSVVAEALATVDSLPEETTPSMHKDLLAGRRLEVSFLSGTVLRLGRERDVATPIHRAAYACLKPHAAGAARERAPLPPRSRDSTT